MVAGFEDEQTCPFCNAKWGSCVHYDVLLEWENDAAKHQLMRARERSAALGEREQPHHENHVKDE